MRDRLIELIKNAEEVFPKDKPVLDIEEFVADYLLAKGVIVLPCKVGDTVFIIDDSEDEYGESYVLGVEVLQFFINKNGIALDLKMPLGLRINTWEVVGKNVFLTETEAEKALAKMKGGME